MAIFSAWSRLYIRMVSGFTPGNMPIEATKFFSAQMISALEALHKEGIVHWDLKPQNVMIDANLHCKVIDFDAALDMNGEQV